MKRMSLFLMLIFIPCFLSSCSPAGVSSNYPQQASGKEARIIDQEETEKATVSNGQGEAGKSGETSGLPGKNIEKAPFAEERFAYRPTRAGGMPTIQNPKGVPYSEETPSLARK